MLSISVHIIFELRRDPTPWSLCFRHAAQAAIVNKDVRATLTEDYFATICDACHHETTHGAPWNPLEG